MPHRFFKRLCYLCFLSFVFSACRTKPHKVGRAYYYWRSDDDLERSEREFLKTNQVKKLYRKVLDVDWDNVQDAIPVGWGYIEHINTTLNEYDSLGIDIVPVVFITNKTFQWIDSADIPQLAKRILRRCLPAYDSTDVAMENNGWWWQNTAPHEIQFDCDWTVTTARNYFLFLQTVSALIKDKPIRLSATIRLHQYKYPEKTGVPPVGRGMLMVYNISDLTQHASVNSIFDYDKAKAYFSNGKPYPLPLDMALPAYSWCLVFRNGKFYQIENGWSQAKMDSCSFLHPSKSGFYQVMQDTVYRGLYLRPGDEIKPETIGKKELLQAARLANKAINCDSFHVAMFELSTAEIKNYNHETIEAVYHSFK